MKKTTPPRIKKLPTAKQFRLDELLEKNREGNITSAEKKRLEALVYQAEVLMVENAQRLAEYSDSTRGAPTGAVPVTVWVKPQPAEQ